MTNLTRTQMESAIRSLNCRIDELKNINVNAIQGDGDPNIKAVESKIDQTLADIFGNDTDEYRRHSINWLDPWFGPSSIHEIREGYKENIDGAIAKLQAIIEFFEEKIADHTDIFGEIALKTLGDIEIHPKIKSEVVPLFKDGHYSNAVTTACNILEKLVKEKSKRNDLFGTKLMRTAFSAKNPILKFGGLKNENEEIQEGMMSLYAGTILAIRNPRAHNIIKDEQERALEYIAFLSLLTKLLDETTYCEESSQSNKAT